ncbi:hypothetical protein CF326_g4137 [Tilletia indica]|nr:hypothetical protein CF326_g4137 [Tilletia indica]
MTSSDDMRINLQLTPATVSFPPKTFLLRQSEKIQIDLVGSGSSGIRPSSNNGIFPSASLDAHPASIISHGSHFSLRSAAVDTNNIRVNGYLLMSYTHTLKDGDLVEFGIATFTGYDVDYDEDGDPEYTDYYTFRADCSFHVSIRYPPKFDTSRAWTDVFAEPTIYIPPPPSPQPLFRLPSLHPRTAEPLCVVAAHSPEQTPVSIESSGSSTLQAPSPPVESPPPCTSYGDIVAALRSRTSRSESAEGPATPDFARSFPLLPSSTTSTPTSVSTSVSDKEETAPVIFAQPASEPDTPLRHTSTADDEDEASSVTNRDIGFSPGPAHAADCDLGAKSSDPSTRNRQRCGRLESALTALQRIGSAWMIAWRDMQRIRRATLVETALQRLRSAAEELRLQDPHPSSPTSFSPVNALGKGASPYSKGLDGSPHSASSHSSSLRPTAISFHPSSFVNAAAPVSHLTPISCSSCTLDLLLFHSTTDLHPETKAHLSPCLPIRGVWVPTRLSHFAISEPLGLLS